jgi:hypothetical protein
MTPSQYAVWLCGTRLGRLFSPVLEGEVSANHSTIWQKFRKKNLGQQVHVMMTVNPLRGRSHKVGQIPRIVP